jgi:hypothetical protein
VTPALLRWPIWTGIALFVPLMAASVVLYPGGVWGDPTAVGDTFWRNFWCDLTQDPALNGQPNALGAALARWAMVALAFALVPYWLLVSSQLAARGVARCVRALGIAGAVGLTLVAHLPTDRAPLLHAIAILLAGPAGIAAGVLTLIGLSKVEPRSRLVQPLGWALALFAAVTLTQYARQTAFGGAEASWLPALQKLPTTLLLIWMLVVTGDAQRRGP